MSSSGKSCVGQNLWSSVSLNRVHTGILLPHFVRILLLAMPGRSSNKQQLSCVYLFLEIGRLVYLGRAAALEQIACNHNIAMEPSSEADAATNRVDKTTEQTCIAIRSFVPYLFIRYSVIEARFTQLQDKFCDTAIIPSSSEENNREAWGSHKFLVKVR